ncbi:MAG: hypothetical protein KIT24_06950 [Phycisphaeraceae bacterium]|nr:hypothetical protein [Phycisphaeraceae bacterium]
MALPLVVVTEELHPEAIAWLEARCEVVGCPAHSPDLGGALASAEGLIVRTYTKVDAELLARAPRLKVVGRAGVGLENIDLGACRERGIAVVHTPDANTGAVVEFVVATIFDALRPRVFLDKPMELPVWQTLRNELVAKREVGELVLGIVGLGRIGSRLARAAAGLGMTVHYHDVREIEPSARHGAEPATLDRVMTASDIISIHVDGRPENARFLEAALLSRMKPEVVFVNTSRGFVIDNFALADFMIGHPEALAILDVHEPEPFGVDYPLLDIANVHLTPHIAAATAPAKARMSRVVEDVWRVLSGETPRWRAEA